MAQDEHHHVDLDEIAKDNIGRDRSAYLTNELDQTYLPVVDRLLAGCDSESSAILTDDLKKVIGSIVTFQQPLPLECISSLLDVERGTIDRVLNGLHSAFDVPADPAQPVRLLHPSFRDFLLAPEKKGIFKFWVDEHRAHTFVARQCLKLLSRSGVLQQDICGLRSPGAWRNTVDDQTLKRCLPAEVRYACRYWIRHLIKGSTEDQDVWESAFVFFKVHFLHWLEAMSLIRRLPDALTAVTALQKKAAFVSYADMFEPDGRLIVAVIGHIICRIILISRRRRAVHSCFQAHHRRCTTSDVLCRVGIYSGKQCCADSASARTASLDSANSKDSSGARGRQRLGQPLRVFAGR